jgi:nicotinamidase-related amidase
MKVPLSFASSKVAILFVDFQEEQRVDPTIQPENLDIVLGKARQLLSVARERGVPVFHAGYVRDFAIRPPRPFELRSPDGRASFSDKTNPLVAFCKEVAPAPGETVILKNDASAFEEGSLAGRLHDLGTEWLIIAGVWTEQCIAASVRDAMAAGFRVLIVKDVCTSGTMAMHQSAVLNLANRLYGGAVADLDRTLALLRGETAEVWRTQRPVPIRFTFDDMTEHYDSL